MVESKLNHPSGTTAFKPSEAEQALITKNFGEDAIIDEFFKASVTLSKEEADNRAKLISEIEYDY